ncbi:MAG: hypothetical protein ABI182_05890 [Candidatus Baltobacteraceae bacterium]
MNTFFLAAGVVLLAVLPIGVTQTGLATAASTLFESLPFILAGTLLAGVASRWGQRLIPLLGCGCGAGPSARSLPAAAATWIVLGAPVALARLGAAFVVAAALRRSFPHRHESGSDPPLAQLAGLLPFALGAAAFVQITAAWLDFSRLTGPLGMLGGAMVGFGFAPCALGAVAIGGSLRHTAPTVALGFLSVAGIVDARAFASRHVRADSHDGFAYACAALACGIVAIEHGDALVNPRFTIALWLCAAALSWCAWRFRANQAATARWGPMLMLIGAVVGAPAPQYHATETSLASAFVGESLDFTGTLTQTRGATTLVRYAITCCRADASPVVVRLSRSLPHAHGWVRAHGTFVQVGTDLRLAVDRWTPLAPPADPFVYR